MTFVKSDLRPLLTLSYIFMFLGVAHSLFSQNTGCLYSCDGASGSHTITGTSPHIPLPGYPYCLNLMYQSCGSDFNGIGLNRFLNDFNSYLSSIGDPGYVISVSYTHLRAHETVLSRMPSSA